MAFFVVLVVMWMAGSAWVHGIWIGTRSSEKKGFGCHYGAPEKSIHPRVSWLFFSQDDCCLKAMFIFIVVALNLYSQRAALSPSRAASAPKTITIHLCAWNLVWCGHAFLKKQHYCWGAAQLKLRMTIARMKMLRNTEGNSWAERHCRTVPALITNSSTLCHLDSIGIFISKLQQRHIYCFGSFSHPFRCILLNKTTQSK